MTPDPDPQAPPLPSLRRSPRIHLLIVFILAFDIAFMLQKTGGAYESEFGGHPDEAAHYVTGLFVRDASITAWKYITNGFRGSPIEAGRNYAEQFYRHYPKVALGVWPPAFYIVQSAWTLPFGESRTSVLLLMGFLAACVATVLYRALVLEFGWLAASAAALAWLVAPAVRAQYAMVMAETLSTLAIFTATLAWGRYLDSRKTRDALWFALLASLAILTKGTGLALLLMCGFSIVICSAWNVFRSRAAWLAALLVALIAGPWTWFFRNYGTKVGGWADNSGGFSWSFIREAMPFYAVEIFTVAGIAIAAFALAGIIARMKNRHSGKWAAQIALIPAVLLFQSLIPVGIESRHILSVAPTLTMLSIAGILAIARLPALSKQTASQPYRERLWIVLLLLLVLPQSLIHREIKGYTGFEPLALEILKAPEIPRVLISSDASGEGMLIAEIAMRDHRPSVLIERGSKSLVREKGRTWDGKNLRERFNDTDLLAYLTSGGLDLIVLDDAVPEHKRAPYHDQIRRVIQEHPHAFWPISESPILREGQPVRSPAKLYRITGSRSISSL